MAGFAGEPHDGHCQGALAATRFADEGEALSLFEIERDAVDRFHGSARRAVIDTQVFDAESVVFRVGRLRRSVLCSRNHELGCGLDLSAEPRVGPFVKACGYQEQADEDNDNGDEREEPPPPHSECYGSELYDPVDSHA